MNLNQLVVLGIMLEANHGIINKAPGYLVEKYHQVEGQPECPENLLDPTNRAKYDHWVNHWTSDTRKEAKVCKTL